MRLFGVYLYALVPALMLSVTLSLPQLCTAQDCEALKSASVEDAIRALDRGEIHTGSCSRAVFQLIAHLPQEKAIPILIGHLGYERPPSNEPHGLISRCPAVDALYDIGLAAEPALIDFIAQHEDDNSIERHSALEALALIRHFDVVPTIKLLRERSAAVAGTPAAARLESAAQYMLNTFCPGKRLQKCEEGLRQSDSGK